ncbi:MAG: M23 family metallopeptidase [Deltaproteobacteria bacterium]|nr:M23 family metallopeptidase [Deltaproteobacteria bacterium]MBI2180451.1 M23 family metallopeptidase [Deltaproteobacteria bacterium]MBI2368330.1 M23 family metallopeptidase [Deltaproteobacteria bacterium]MBI3066666.1 M23 family metallopeptidase [Deltaproteobacteria bacterium]
MNFLRSCLELTRRFAGATFAAAVLLLCGPLLGTVFERYESEIVPPASSNPSWSRLGVTLQRGDTLLSVLTHHGLQRSLAHGLIERIAPFVNVRKLRPGDEFQLLLDSRDRTVQGMEVVLEDNLLRLTSTPDGWSTERHEIPSVRANGVKRGSITDNLYENGIKAGLTAQQILDLARVFEYEIDFFSDFQRGDTFAAVVEETRYADGRRTPGRIVAAELEANSKPVSAFYFVPRDQRGAYYDEQGHSLRRAFLRAPLSYARISSTFTGARRHPIFRTVRPHRAIDYAAPAATPVVAIGRGRVEFAGWREGYGNLVEIRHPNDFMSRYGHFSRIGEGIRRGSQVDAGDVIGYVGQTGHTTGPHLHFEFLKRGQNINFLALDLPKIERLKGADFERFIESRNQQLATLRNGGHDTAMGIKLE